MSALTMKGIKITCRYGSSAGALRRVLGTFAALPGQKEEIVIVRDVDFSLEQGEALALMGDEKRLDVLLLAAAGILRPAEGTCTRRGVTAAVIGGRDGLLDQLTGEENIRLRCRLAGMGRNTAALMGHYVAEFSELGSRLYDKAGTYAPQERARLALAFALGRYPDLVAEKDAISRCGLDFQEKCIRRLQQLRRMGCAVLMADSPAASRVCQRAAWIEEDGVRRAGPYFSLKKAFLRPRRVGEAPAADFPISVMQAETSAPLVPPVQSEMGRLGRDLADSLRLMQTELLRRRAAIGKMPK